MPVTAHAPFFSAEFEVAAFGRWCEPRAAMTLDATVARGRLDRALCKVTDISRRGARLQTYSTLREGAIIRLTLPQVGEVDAVVRWADDFEAGCEFRYPLPPAAYEALIDV